MRAPVFTARASILSPAPTVKTVCTLWFCCTARCGTRITPVRAAAMTDAAELAGEQTVLRIGKLACNVQGAGPRVHLIERIRHPAGMWKNRVIGQNQFELRVFLRRSALLRHERQVLRFAGLERTQIGSSGTMVVSGCAAFGLTRPPTGRSVSPIRPLMGAWMTPYCTLSVAVSSAPRCACTLPCVDCTWVSVVSLVCSTFA